VGEGQGEGRRMRNAILCFALGALLFALCSSAQAQQPKKIPRIGILSFQSLPSGGDSNVDTFRQGLRDIGYVEGKNIVIEYR
jgi:putative ABC transport system substrate-binding protein